MSPEAELLSGQRASATDILLQWRFYRNSQDKEVNP